MRQGPVSEIVPMCMVLIQISQFPKGTTGFQLESIRQPGSGQCLEIGLFQFNLILAFLAHDRRRDTAIEFIVDTSGEI